MMLQFFAYNGLTPQVAQYTDSYDSRCKNLSYMKYSLQSGCWQLGLDLSA